MSSERELREKLFEVENALANQRIEGLEVDPATIADLMSYAHGELDLETARQKALQRIAKRVAEQN